MKFYSIVCADFSSQFVAGPIGIDAKPARNLNGFYSSSRSPFDKSESDFTLLKSNWWGLSMTDKSIQYANTRAILVPTKWKDPMGYYTDMKGSAICYMYGPCDSDMYYNLAASPLKRGHVVLLRRKEAVIWSIQKISTTSIELRLTIFDLDNQSRYLQAVWSETFTVAAQQDARAKSLMNMSGSEFRDQFYSKVANSLYINSSDRYHAEVVDLPVTIVSPEHFGTPFEDAEVYVQGDLAQMCVDSVKATKVSTFVFFKELPELKSIWKALPKSTKDLKNPKFWASLYLAFKFGIESTARDASALEADIQTDLNKKKPAYCNTRVTTSSSSVWKGFDVTHVYNMKMKYYRDDLLAVRALRFLYDYNLMPTLGTAWEMVPFSFVIDWVFHVDKMIGSVDFQGDYATLMTRSVTFSDRKTVSGLIPPVKGVLLPSRGVTTLYSRTVSAQAQNPIPRFTVSNPFKNWVVGLALFIQRLK